jgi:signal-transduction protein with cAMP-binding, CBS, and nucleotidyltransferase domain
MTSNELINRIVTEMLNKNMHEESVKTIITETVRQTFTHCINRVQHYVEHNVPKSMYVELLNKEFK